MSKINNRGFSVVEILLVVVVIGLVIGLGVYVYKATQAPGSNTGSDPSGQGDQAKTKTYSHPEAHFSLRYPEDWAEVTKTGFAYDEKNHATSTTLTAPSGLELKIDANLGGRGGNCEPAATDKPHAASNICATEEILSIEPLDVYVRDAKDMTKPNRQLKLVTKKATDPGTDKSQYIIGLEADSESRKLEVNKPVMGILVGISEFTSYFGDGEFDWRYIDIYAKSDKQEFLTNKDGEEIKEILRSFRSS